MQYRFYVTIERTNMLCLVTAGKHVKDIRAIAKQPAITTKGMLGAVFSVGTAQRLSIEDPRPAECVSSD
jgi:hypothetical protein